MNRPNGRLDFVGIAAVGTAACTRLRQIGHFLEVFDNFGDLELNLTFWTAESRHTVYYAAPWNDEFAQILFCLFYASQAGAQAGSTLTHSTLVRQIFSFPFPPFWSFLPPSPPFPFLISKALIASLDFLLTPPHPISFFLSLLSPPLSFSYPSSPFTLPSRSRPQIQLGCGVSRIWCILALKSDTWWYQIY